MTEAIALQRVPVSASTPVEAPEARDLASAARQFEAIFLRQMISTMRAASLGDELFGSTASDQFRSMSDARLADSMAGRFGIAKILESQLAK
jgi:peptidoglycan hydrolase FlgJ